MIRPGTMPSTKDLLALGGDGRIAIDPVTKLNRYFTSPDPEPLGGFGSCTASNISPAGYFAADALRLRIKDDLRRHSAEDIYRREVAAMMRELLDLNGLKDDDRVQVAFAPSGTDVHLVAMELFARKAARPIVAITIEANETGSGMPKALASRHFSERTAWAEVPLGERASSLPISAPIAVRARRPDGALRSANSVSADIERLCRRLSSTHQIVLVITDVSKTGLLWPSLATAFALKAQYGDQLDILVDACQFRISSDTLRAYLARGCVVAITGSKFYSGPIFCGALVVPSSWETPFQDGRDLSSLSAYLGADDMPSGWGMGLRARCNFGHLLRWRAALTEMGAFHAVPSEQRYAILHHFEKLVADLCGRYPYLKPMTPFQPDRGVFGGGQWDDIPTIFPLLLSGDSGRGWLNATQTSAVYAKLRRVPLPGGSIGQPVMLGDGGGSRSVLRVCASSRLVVEVASQGLDGISNRLSETLGAVNSAVRSLGGSPCASSDRSLYAN